MGPRWRKTGRPCGGGAGCWYETFHFGGRGTGPSIMWSRCPGTMRRTRGGLTGMPTTITWRRCRWGAGGWRAARGHGLVWAAGGGAGAGGGAARGEAAWRRGPGDARLHYLLAEALSDRYEAQRKELEDRAWAITSAEALLKAAPAG